MKFKMRKSTAVITALSMLTVGSSVYAAEYHYDGLNRITSVEKAGKTMAYIYDQGGNLLSVTSDSSTKATSSLAQTSSVLSGWTPYKTAGMQPYYQTASVKIQKKTKTDEQSSSTDEKPSSEEIPVVDEVPAIDEVPDAEEQPLVNDETSSDRSSANEEEFSNNNNVPIEKPSEEAEVPSADDESSNTNNEISVEEDTEEAAGQSEDVVAPETESSNEQEVQWIVLAADRTGGVNVYRDIPVQGDTVYTYQGSARTEEMRDAAVQVVVNYYDAQNQLIQYDNLLNEKQDTDWKAYDGTLKTPENAILARVHLQVVSLKAKSYAKAGFSDVAFEIAASEEQQ